MAPIHVIKTEVGTGDEALSSTAGWAAKHQQSLPCYQIKLRSTSDDLLPREPSALTKLLEEPCLLPTTQDHFLSKINSER